MNGERKGTMTTTGPIYADVADFIEYCCKFYDVDTPESLYPMATRDAIVNAIAIHIAARPFPFDGDSMDREAVRTILETNPHKETTMTTSLVDPTYWTNHSAEDLRAIVDRMTASSLAAWSTNRAMSIEAMEIANAAWTALTLKDGTNAADR